MLLPKCRGVLSLLVAATGCQTTIGAVSLPVLRQPLAIARFRADSAAFTAYSGLADSLRVVIRDARRWQDYWHRINSPFFPAPDVPAIDFRREMVVLAALGRRPSLGFDIVIESAARDSAGVEVFLHRSKPAAGCPVGAAITQPVDLARIPASDLPVRFTELITTIQCGEP